MYKANSFGLFSYRLLELDSPPVQTSEKTPTTDFSVTRNYSTRQSPEHSLSYRSWVIPSHYAVSEDAERYGRNSLRHVIGIRVYMA